MATVDDGTEEEDFMSDKFLAQLSDVRPGLHAAGRRRPSPREAAAAAAAAQPKSRKRQAQEAFLTGLATPVGDCDGGGGSTAARSIMERMGYRPGSGLGRLGQGRLEPLPLNLKADRTGLGHRPRGRKQPAAATTSSSTAMTEAAAASTDDFRRHMSARYARVGGLSDLARAQRVCRQLDEEEAAANADVDGAEVVGPPASWFWPEDQSNGDGKDKDEKEEEGIEDEEQPSPEAMLSCIVAHLRQAHFYCMWCGHRFESAALLAEECPGPDKADHDDEVAGL